MNQVRRSRSCFRIVIKGQCNGIRKRLRWLSVRVKTYVEGSRPGETNVCSSTVAPGTTPATAALIPEDGRSGNDLPAGTGIASVFPGDVAGRRICRRKTRVPCSCDADFLSERRRRWALRRWQYSALSLSGDTITAHLPSGETPYLLMTDPAMICSRPLPSFLIRASTFVFSSRERKTISPSAPKDT